MLGSSGFRSWIPPVLREAARRFDKRVLRFSGEPRDWDAALEMSTGYDAQSIVARVADATRAVVAGRAAFERDSVLFGKHAYRFEILAALLRCAVLNGGTLSVMDFGGSMGSTYRQCRPFLEGLRSIRWHVVEQPAFVDVAQREFTTRELSFGVSPCFPDAANRSSVILASSVLQYLQSPEQILRELTACGASHLVIDRTPLSQLSSDRLCIQHVPRHIYEASYPCWILSKAKLLDELSPAWDVLADFPCEDGSFRTDDGLQFEFRGLILEAKMP